MGGGVISSSLLVSDSLQDIRKINAKKDINSFK